MPHRLLGGPSLPHETPQAQTLTEELKRDNHLLLRALAKVHRGAKNADPVAFKDALEAFQKLLVPHLMKKATKVYSYLRRQSKVRGESEEYDLVTAYKVEMTRIGDAALRFVEVHRKTPAAELDFEQIRITLNTFGHLVTDRLRREEEQLHPILDKDP